MIKENYSNDLLLNFMEKQRKKLILKISFACLGGFFEKCVVIHNITKLLKRRKIMSKVFIFCSYLSTKMMELKILAILAFVLYGIELIKTEVKKKVSKKNECFNCATLEYGHKNLSQTEFFSNYGSLRCQYICLKRK